MQETVLFGRYRLIEPAGAGGSAQVWRALDTATGDDVAVKRLHPIVFADPAARQRLERESRALESLDHPNVVALRDVHLEDDEAALILEYVDGVSLADRIASGPPMAVGEVVSLVEDVASALTAAHALGIVHRDVKPANVILARDGRALLTDFGIAADGTTDPDATAALTATGTIVGTFRYMAPELFRGAPASAATDQYALAAVAYELLAGRPPYDATTPVALAEAQAAPPPPPAGVRPALASAVLRGLEHDPASRHGDVTAFATAVAGAVRAAPSALDTDVATAVGGGAAVAAGAVEQPPSVAPPRRDPDRPRWMSLAAVAALAVVMAVLGAMAGGLNDREPTGDTPAGAATIVPVAVTATPDPTPEPAADDGDDDGERDDAKPDDKPDDKPAKPDKPDKGKGNDKGRGNGGD